MIGNRLAIGTLLQGKYRIIRILGTGGMGAVYLAQHIHLGYVAVKEMFDLHTDPGMRNQAVLLFQKEARLLFGLRHPNLPHVSDFFFEGGRWYLVLDYVDGESLEGLLLQRQSPFPEAQVLNWAGQLCDVLDYLHRQQPPVIFRDLKPANIMVERNGVLKLIDFGIARFFRPMGGSDTIAMGTPGYASPEHYSANQQTDARSDIYSLGATLYRLTTGREPGIDPSFFTQNRLRAANGALSPRLESIILQAVQADPDRRFQSAGEMKAALLENPIPCPHCGASNRRGARFCHLCGKDLLAKTVPTPLPPKTLSLPWAMVGGFGLVAALAVLLMFSLWALKVGPFNVPVATRIAEATRTVTETPRITSEPTRTVPTVTTVAPATTVAPPTTRAPTVSPTATSGPRLLFGDDFSDPSSGWAQSSNDIFEQDYEGGEYSILAKKPNYYNRNCRRAFIDFALEIDARQLDTSLERYGLMFRGQDTNFYAFRIARDGTYSFGKHTTNGGFSELFGPTLSSAVNIDGWNHLKVVVKGSDFTLSINGRELTTVSDKSFPDGCAGFVACTCNSSPSVHIHFDNLKVYSVE